MIGYIKFSAIIEQRHSLHELQLWLLELLSFYLIPILNIVALFLPNKALLNFLRLFLLFFS